MAIQDSKPGSRLHQTKLPNSSTDDIHSNDTPWQQLMVYDYLLFEAIDAMEQERSTSDHAPLNYHWQQFIQILRLKKPKLGTCLDNLRRGFLAEQEGLQ